MNYYNEWDKYAAQWLRNLIHAKLIPDGHVDDRSITDVEPSDLDGYTQCHFFAGIAGWSYALQLAGWPEDWEIWTGSCPCQPFSVAGQGAGQDDPRHLWPHMFRLIRAKRPAVFMGEQVYAAVGKGWLDGVFADLEGEGYACGAIGVPACAVNAPHRRDRLLFLADANNAGSQGCGRPSKLNDPKGREESVGHSAESGIRSVGNPGGSVCQRVSGGIPAEEAGVRHALRPINGYLPIRPEHAGQGDTDYTGPWGRSEWIVGHDGKARRVEPSIPLLAHGISSRVGRLRSYGNAIVPPLAAELIAAYMETQ